MMGRDWLRSLTLITLPVASSISWCSLALLVPARAQISSDRTLGAESSIVIPNVNIKGIPSDLITGGAIRGTSLFHSFSEFNISEGQGAYFTNPTGIENILSRVTGTNPSHILGRLGVLGKANLFLINPNGIVFGPNATLDVRGSFLESTASAVELADGTLFKATNPSTPPLLTISIPVGLQYRGNEGSIQIQGSSLTVPDGESLTLVGGSVSLDGASLLAAGGRVELGGLVGVGTVGLNVDGSHLRLSFPDGVTRSDVSLTNRARVSVVAGGGGSIAVNARNVDVLGGSVLVGGIRPRLGSVGSIAGDITLNATGEIKVLGGGIFADVQSGAVGKGGDVNLTTGSLSLTDGAQVSSSTRGRGDAGSVTITARDTLVFDGVGLNGFSSGAFSSVGLGAVGRGGNVKIATGSLTLTNGAQVTAATKGQGDAGSVTITARDTLTFDGVGRNNSSSGAFSTVGSRGVGNGGGVNVTTGSLSLTNGAEVSASTFGQGNAGSVTIAARDAITSDGVGRNEFSSGAFSLVGLNAVGSGGGVNVTTGSLFLTNGAEVSASTLGQGNAGSVTINSRDTLTFSGMGGNGLLSGAFSYVGAGAVGKGGDVSVTTGSLFLSDSAQVSAATRGQGDAGSVTIDARDTLAFDGAGNNKFSSGAFSNVGAGAVGRGGSVTLKASSLSLTNGAQVSAAVSVNSLGTGNAGNIVVEANSILLDQGNITAESTTGKGGDIQLRVGDLLLLRRGSLISAVSGTAGNDGRDGNINIDTKFLVAVPSENSDIVATGFGRSVGSNIQVNAKGIFGTQFRERLTPKSDIVATGTVTLSTPGVDPSQGLVALPETIVDPAALIAQNPCERGKGGEFTITGRGGLPPNPSDTLSSDTTHVGLIEPTSNPSKPSHVTPKQPLTRLTHSMADRVVPAMGWVFNDKGEVVLTAYDSTSNRPQRFQQNSTPCRTP